MITYRLATNPTSVISSVSERFPAAVLFADISGFTTLTEQLAQHGPVGAEILTRELNTYFGQLIEIITAHGGDVVKFAGDALTAIWPMTDPSSGHGHMASIENPSPLSFLPQVGGSQGGNLSVVTQQAAVCALPIRSALQDYQTADGLKLALRIGLGAGNLAAIHVGGIYGRWEFVITGPPLRQVSQAEAQAQTAAEYG